MSIVPQQITGLILAGGQGSRMGHVDKGLQTFRDQPMVAHSIARLRPQVPQLAINANRNHDAYAVFGWPVWPDLLPGFAGPLAGLHSGLTHCRTDYLACVPCDSPLLPTDLVLRLATALAQTDAAAAIAVTGRHDENDDQPQRHPVFCLLGKALLPALTAFLQQDGRKMERWFASIATVEVGFDDEQAFSNINTREELHLLEHQSSPPFTNHTATPRNSNQ